MMRLLGHLFVFALVNCLTWQIRADEQGGSQSEPAESASGEQVDAKAPLIVEKVIVQSLQSLPDEFDLSKLPRSNEPIPREGEQVKVDYLDVIDLLINRKPDDPFSIDTQFHVYNGIKQRIIPFKLFNNCLANEPEDEEKSCKKIPLNLNNILDIFDLNKRTLIIIGGFLADAPSDWQLEIAHKWLQLEDLNVVIVSWNKGNKFLYNKAVSNTKVVARQITILLYYLAKLHNMDPRDRRFTDNIMIVGHSLGAHIAGFVGQDFGGRIGRITGLDPAGPAFSSSHESHRLDRNDAIFVDVIHTNADFGFKFFLGIYSQVGHVDYYANDGKWQPNCHVVHFYECNHCAVINYYLAILDHEIVIRGFFDHKSRENYRIVAYRAKSYNQFRSGASMHEHCPSLATDGYDTLMQSGSIDFRRCGIPIDFLKHPREFRQELAEVYHINFEADYKPDQKYWFFTSSKQPFVVDHNLMKLHYDMPEEKYGFDVNKKLCALRMTYTMLNNEKNESRLPKFKPTIMDDGRPQTTIPFVVQERLSRYMLVDIDSDNYYDDDYSSDNAKISKEANDSLLRHVYKIFPAKIELRTEGMYDPREKKTERITRWIFGTHGSNLDKPLKEAIESKRCRYRFKTIRVQPLRKTNRLFMGVYSTKAMLPVGDFTKSGVFRPKIYRLKEGEDVPLIELPEPTEDPTVYLSAIIIGPNHFKVHRRMMPDYIDTPYRNYLKAGGKPLHGPKFLDKIAKKTGQMINDLNPLTSPPVPDESLTYFDLTGVDTKTLMEGMQDQD